MGASHVLFVAVLLIFFYESEFMKKAMSCFSRSLTFYCQKSILSTDYKGLINCQLAPLGPTFKTYLFLLQQPTRITRRDPQ